jgi:hypothetical protein
MSALDLNLAGPIRTAILAISDVTGRLATWEGEPAIFTRRPVPADAVTPYLVISPDVSISYPEDALISKRPFVRRDVTAYGLQGDVPEYRAVEELGYLLKGFFHQNRFAIDVPSFHVVDLMAAGPMAAPVDDEKLVARVVPLSIRLEDLAS